MTPDFAEHFAREWTTAWNAHDLDRILDHYEDSFEMASPLIGQLAGEASGRLRGKAAVRAYWAEALRRIPNLEFELLGVFAGVDSVVIHYRGHRGPAAEVFQFGPTGKVSAAAAHYTQPV